MKIRATELRSSFTPIFKENNEAPESEKVRVSFDKPKAYQRELWMSVKASFNESGKIASSVDLDIKAILSDSNVIIENLELQGEDGTVSKITTGKELVNSRSDLAYLLSKQIANKIMETNVSEEFLKN